MGRFRESPQYVCLDYAALLNEYEHRLVSMERGFQMDQAFLELWVPDDDHNKSLFYLFESAATRGLPGLSVALSRAILDSIDGEGLINQLRSLGGVDVAREKERVVLTVSFEGKEGRATGLDDIPGLSTLHATYRDRLVRESRAPEHEATAAFPSGELKLPKALASRLKMLELPFQGGRFLAAIDPEHGIAHALGYREMPNHVLTRMLELLCREMEGFSVQEIAEHGAIRLENRLRDPGKPLPVRGLVTPETAGPTFKALNQLARDLFRMAREKLSVGLVRNISEKTIGEKWLKCPEAERKKILAKAAAEFLAARGQAGAVDVVGVKGDTQVYLDLEGFPAEREKRLFCRDFERYIKQSVEGRLEVYLPTAEDKLKRDKKSGLVRGAEGKGAVAK